METNIKLVGFGKDLFLQTKVYSVDVPNISNEQLQKVCSHISSTGIAAVPHRSGGKEFIITDNISSISNDRAINIDDWVVKLNLQTKDKKLNLSNPEHRQIMLDLYKRALIIQVQKQGNFWRLDSPRIFYDKTPLRTDSQQFKTDIDAFRRFEISELFVEDEGLGLCVDVGTGFFSNTSVEEYFKGGYEQRFMSLSGRQGEHKGTLLFDSPSGKVKCYFEKYDGKTVANATPPMNIKGQRYENLFDYYKQRSPSYSIKENDMVAMVSFPGLPDKKPVPANKLFLRVSNEKLPREMSNMDKITPDERKKSLQRFWQGLGEFPFGNGFGKVNKYFYSPKPEKKGIIELPDLFFGNGQTLFKPTSSDKQGYKDHFRNRRNYLERYGCYYVPPTLSRSIYFAYPNEVSEAEINKYSKEMCEAVKKLTKVDVEPVLISYSSVEEALISLKGEEDPGVVVFIFNDNDPATYFNISHGLKQWKIKRATTYELNRKFKGLSNQNPEKLKRAKKNWTSYIEMTTFDVIQQMGCMPYIFKKNQNFDMQLVIDVSEKASHFGFSLMMYKDGMRYPVVFDKVHSKPDKKETINKAILEKYFEELITQNKAAIQKNGLSSLLILRDGKDCGEEHKTLNASIEKLIQEGVLPTNFKFAFVEYHKTTLKEVRIWKNSVPTCNVLEGSYLLLDSTTAIIASTGEGTLTQGTSAPLLVKAKYGNVNLKAILEDIFISSQLNFSSPGVAQRLTYSAKRIDDQLKERRMQEIERIK